MFFEIPLGSQSLYSAEAATLPAAQWENVKYNGSRWVAVSTSGFPGSAIFAYSDDRTTWTQCTTSGLSGTGGGYYALAWDGSYWCVIQNSTAFVGRSSDGITWSAVTDIGNPLVHHWSLAARTDLFLFVKSGTECQTSVDHGLTWLAHSMPSSAAWDAVADNGTVFCAIECRTGPSTKAATSTDGFTWQAQTLPSSQTWKGIIWTGRVFFAFPYSGGTTGATSPDGVTWSTVTLPSGSPGWGGAGATDEGTILLTIDGGAGLNDDIRISYDDGVTWNNALFTGNEQWTGVGGDGTHLIAVSRGVSGGSSTLANVLTFV